MLMTVHCFSTNTSRVSEMSCQRTGCQQNADESVLSVSVDFARDFNVINRTLMCDLDRSICFA